MRSELSGLRTVVTGGASGIGAAITDRLLAGGATVAVLDRTTDGAAAGAIALVADVTDDPSVRAAIDHAANLLGGIDVLVNCAGIGAQGTAEANSDDDWHRVWDVNVVGIARVTRAALPYLRRAPGSAIVNIASVAAHVGLPQRALYSATKGAVVALTRAMAADLLADGIRVNAVSPGTADTPWVGRLLETADDPVQARAALSARQPHGRLVSAEEVAAAAAYLASPAAGSTNATVLEVDGGLGRVLA
jgi:NAD(P)-dependent dehydrogenase (short-subunit alcohol dehydrogenase family)